MDAAAQLLIATWLIFLWIVGWLALPLARVVFVNLPDGGLAAGRTLVLTLVSLLLFWGASFRLLPLTMAPLFVIGLPIMGAALALRRRVDRDEFVSWVRAHRRALLVSDAVFVAIFGFFLWVRMRHPEINDLEKPMDAALIATLLRTHFLPAENPWFSGVPFTNYYYFGHFMGSLLTRTLATPLPFAYNLVLPAFSALFVTPLWSLCAALTGSLRRGLVAASMVALLGHFEPLRQWLNPVAGNGSNLFRLDWWSTTRVIPDTINEYPIFTLSIGDAHGHFFALALAAVYFCLCFALFADDPPTSSPVRLNRRRIVVVLTGAVLGLFWMTNTWDLPIYGGLALLCALWTLPLGSNLTTAATAPEPATPKLRKKRKAEPTPAPAPLEPAADPWLKLPTELLWALVPFPVARLVAWPYLRLFQSQVSGAVKEFWPYPGLEFLLFWGGFLALWLVVVAVWWPPRQRKVVIGLLVVLLALIVLPVTRPFLSPLVVALTLLMTLAVAWPRRPRWRITKGEVTTSLAGPTTGFVVLLAIMGLLALLAPMLFYMQGLFGDGPLRHQDTVFKFFIEAWLLLGTAAACGALTLWEALARARTSLAWPLAAAWSVLWCIPCACAGIVVWTRTVRDAPRDGGNFILSLDGARHISSDDRAAMDWLSGHAREGDAVLEAVHHMPGGGVGGDFESEFGRVAALTGVPDPVSWPNPHIRSWGAQWPDITQRADAVKRAYAWPDNATGLAALRQLHVRYVFVGDTEHNVYNAATLARLRAALPVAFSSGNTFVAQVP